MFPFLFASIFLEHKWRNMAQIILFFGLILLFLLRTRTSWIAVSATALLFCCSYILHKSFYKNENKISTRFSKLFLIQISVFIFAIGVIIFFPTAIEFSQNSIQKKTKKTVPANPYENVLGSTPLAAATDANTIKTRIMLWENSYEMFKEHPFMGVGAGNWQIYFPKYGIGKFAEQVAYGITHYQRPHNDFFWVLNEFGIIGFIFYVLIFFSVFYYLFQLLKTLDNADYRWFYVFLILTMIGYLLIAFVDFPLERIEHQIVLITIFSIASGEYYKKVHKKNQPVFVSLFYVFLIFILPILFSLIVTINRFNGEKHSHKLYKAHYNKQWQTMIKEADLAKNTFYSIDPFSAPVFWYRGVANFALENKEQAKIDFEKAYSIHPNHIHILNNLASCYEKMGNHSEAINFYDKALVISPDFVEARLNLSAAFYNSKEYTKAFETIDKCPLATTDEKYNLFLPAILIAAVDEILKHQTDEKIISNLTSLKNNSETIVKQYKSSKSANQNFEKYLLKSIKNTIK